MENRVAAVAATTSVSLDRSPPNAVRANDPPPPEWAVQKTEQADLRLIIEEAPDHGAYVYKTVDRRTGEVVSQIPREEVLKLREDPDYEVGDVVSARA